MWEAEQDKVFGLRNQNKGVVIYYVWVENRACMEDNRFTLGHRGLKQYQKRVWELVREEETYGSMKICWG